MDGYSVSLVRPRNPEGLLDEAAFERDEFLPYWAELWPSAVALARHVAKMRLSGIRVLELGCGLGLPSIAAALAGSDGVATDWSPEALSFTRANANRNGVQLRTELLRWGGAPRVEPADLVIAADVLYEHRNGAALLELLPRIVAPAGRMVLADPGRRHAAPFLETAAARWRVETTPDPLLPRGGIYQLWIE